YNGSSQLYYTPLLMNLGTVTCNGSLSFCYSTPTVVSNGGTWNITMTSSDGGLSSGGPGMGFFTNAGVVQKIGGPGVTWSFTGYPFVNLPSGIIRAASGVLTIPGYTNVAGELQLAGGTFGKGFYNTNGMTGGTLDGAGTFDSAAAFDGGTVSPGGAAPAL